MSFTLRNSQSNTNVGTTLTITKPTGLTVGDLMVASIGKDDDPAMGTLPSGWTEMRTAGVTTGNDVRVWVGYKIADAADVAASNFTWGTESEDWSGTITAFIPSNSNPVLVEVSATAWRANDITPISTAITAATAGNLLVGMAVANTADGAMTAVTSGYTLGGQPTTGAGNGDNSSCLYYDLSAAGGETTFEAGNVDAAGESYAYIAEFSDSASTDFSETPTDPVGVADVVSRVHSAARTPTDPVGVTDVVSTAKAITVTITDAVGVTDTTVDEKTGAAEIVPTLLDANVDATGTNNPYSTASASPSADAVLLVEVTTRAGSAAEIPPAITGGGLTWTQVSTIQHDTGGTLSYMHVFRAVTGGSPGSFSLTITCPSNPVGVHWHWYEFTSVDTTTDQGVVQVATNLDAGGTVGTITSTFGGTPGASNAVVSFCSIQEPNTTTFTEDTGYTEGSKVGPSEAEQSATQYRVGGADTTVVGAWVTEIGPIGIISIELKASAASVPVEEAVTDPVGVTDVVARTITAARTATDPVGVTDSVTAAKGVARSATDDVGVTDSVATAKDSPRTVTDPVGVADTVAAAKAVSPTADEPVGVADAVSRQVDAARSATDAVGVTDVVSAAKAVAPAVTDPVGVTDTTTAVKAVGQAVDDSVGVTDIVTAVKTINVTITESVGVADSVEAAKAVQVTVTDPVGVTDDVTDELLQYTLETVTDPVGITDVVSAVVAKAREPIDSVSVADVVSAVMARPRTSTDPVGVTDAVVTSLAAARLTTDPVGVTDTVSVAKTINVTVSESVGVADSVGVAKAIAVTVTDGVGVTDIVTAVLSQAGRMSWLELEVPASASAGQVTWIVLQVPNFYTGAPPGTLLLLRVGL